MNAINNTYRTRKLIEIMQAYLRGEQIEYRTIHKNEWCPTLVPMWSFDECEYRIKSESTPVDNTKSVVMDIPKNLEDTISEFIKANEAGKHPSFIIGCMLPNPFTDKPEYAFFNFKEGIWEIVKADLKEV